MLLRLAHGRQIKPLWFVLQERDFCLNFKGRAVARTYSVKYHGLKV